MPHSGPTILPQRLVAAARLVELGAREQHALGVDARDVDDKSRGRRPDVEVVGGIGGERHQLALVEHRDDDGDVRGVAGPVVGVVVDDHVAVVPLAAP